MGGMSSKLADMHNYFLYLMGGIYFKISKLIIFCARRKEKKWLILLFLSLQYALSNYIKSCGGNSKKLVDPISPLFLLLIIAICVTLQPESTKSRISFQI